LATVAVQDSDVPMMPVGGVQVITVEVAVWMVRLKLAVSSFASCVASPS
jgi:hypothetical protein